MTIRADYNLKPGQKVNYIGDRYSEGYDQLKEYYTEKQIIDMLNTLP